MFIDQQKILDATDGGLKIILDYYPDAAKAAQDQRLKFKVRKGEKTPSASLKKIQDGTWIVTDWGADSQHRNAIQLCMYEENLDFRPALEFLAAKYGVTGEKGEKLTFQKDYEKEPAQKGDSAGDYLYEIKEFTQKELELLGPGVTAAQCRRHELFSLAHYIYVSADKKTGELVRHVFKSNENYPVFQFIFEPAPNERWGKRLEPRAQDKADRFRYFGERPGNEYMMGLHVVKKAFKKINEEDGTDPNDLNSLDDMEREEQRVQNKKLKEIR